MFTSATSIIARKRPVTTGTPSSRTASTNTSISGSACSAGDNDVAKTVTTPAVRGDYVVTPEHLRGKRPLEFIGRDPEYRPDPEY